MFTAKGRRRLRATSSRLAPDEQATSVGVVAPNAAAPKMKCLRIKIECPYQQDEESIVAAENRLYVVLRELGTVARFALHVCTPAHPARFRRPQK